MKGSRNVHEHVRGRPRGTGGRPQFRPQHIILFTLWDNVKPLSLKQIIERTHLNRKTVISCLQFFEKEKIVETEKVGRERRRNLTAYGLEYWFKLRVKHAVSLATPIRFYLIQQGRVARLMKRYNVTVGSVLQRLLEKYPNSLGNAKIFNAKVVEVAYELIDGEKNRRIIAIDD